MILFLKFYPIYDLIIRREDETTWTNTKKHAHLRVR